MSFLRPAMIPLLNFHPDHAPCVLKRLLLTTGAKFCHVRKSCVFTHWKNSHEGEVVALKRHFVFWCARRGWSLWRFASLIPSGCRLTPIHKVMGDHASRGSTPRRAFLPRVLFLWSVSVSFPDFCWLRLESFPEMSLLWLFIFWIHFPWFILYRENVLDDTRCACVMRFVPRKRFNLHRMCSFVPIYIYLQS